jgi:hypothetical protein
MSEFALTLLRLGFLALLWVVVFAVIAVMRRDLSSVRPGPQRRDAVKPAAKEEPARKTKLHRVVVTDEFEQRREYTLADGMTFGRGSQCAVVLSDDYASTQHASVSLTDKGWFYTDLGSTNGSWMDRKRIDAPLKLKPGTTVTIGKTSMRFEK